MLLVPVATLLWSEAEAHLPFLLRSTESSTAPVGILARFGVTEKPKEERRSSAAYCRAQ